jgi:FMN-dependent NADH-azoreductase
MSNLLYIQASPREGRSHSRAVADAFVETYGKTHPGATVRTLDLFKADLPAFDGLALQAKYSILHGQAHSDSEKRAWADIERVIGEFLAADRYVFAVPMWNFGIPYRLKHYLDVIIQPGYTFSWSEEAGYQGLARGRRAVAVYARGGAYPEGSPEAAYDLQRRYFEQALGFIGITDVIPVVVEPTLAGPQAADATREAGVRRALDLARTF